MLIKREVVIIAILVEVAIHPGQLLLVLLVRGMPSSRVLPTFPSLSHSLGLYGVQDCHRVSGILGCFYLEQRILLIGHSELDNSFCFIVYLGSLAAASIRGKNSTISGIQIPVDGLK